nr:MAG: hypothetical protein DIU80_04270 [Chloroflexota bacterium]
MALGLRLLLLQSSRDMRIRHRLRAMASMRAYAHILTSPAVRAILPVRPRFAGETPMTNTSARELKKRQLQERLRALTEEAEAVHRSLLTTIDTAAQVRLKRQYDDLLAQIEATERELHLQSQLSGIFQLRAPVADFSRGAPGRLKTL